MAICSQQYIFAIYLCPQNFIHMLSPAYKKPRHTNLINKTAGGGYKKLPKKYKTFCLYCSTPLTSRRKHYCDDFCRLAYFRKFDKK